MPLVSIDGLLYVTDERIYMQPLHPQTLGKSVINLKIRNITQLFKRRYTLMDLGMEVVSQNDKGKRKTMYLVFKNGAERNQVYQALLKVVKADCITTERDVQVYMQQWAAGQMTNFDYLMILNSYAQRSMQDLTQYPVMPWVIKDYKSPVLDLTDPMIFRDLSKPIGAMDPTRLRDFRKRYDETPDGVDKFLYGSHYSCPGYVIGFHLRNDPQWMIKF